MRIILSSEPSENDLTMISKNPKLLNSLSADHRPPSLSSQRVYDLFQVKFSSSASTKVFPDAWGLGLLIMVALLLRGGARLLILLLCPAWLYSPVGPSFSSPFRKSAMTLKYSRTTIWLQLPSSTSSFPILPPSLSSRLSRLNPQCPPLSVNTRRK